MSSFDLLDTVLPPEGRYCVMGIGKYPDQNFVDTKEEVEEAALTSFYRQGLNKTRDKTGILIFISVFEHQVRVLADQGINDRVDSSVWQELVDTIIAGIKTRRQAEAICVAVVRCGELLTEHFPIKHDDTDELSNLIVEE